MDKKIVIKMNTSMFFHMENLNRCNESSAEQFIFLSGTLLCGFNRIVCVPPECPI